MNYEGTFKSADGLDFYERRWVPETPRTHAILIHGFGEHCGRYGEFAEALNAGGIAVHTYDQRGFGLSSGERNTVRNFDPLVRDLEHFVAYVRPRFEDKPWFFVSHSMGGLVLARYAETHQVDARGLVFCSPFLGFSEDIPPILVSLADILGALTPWIPIKAVDNRYLSRDPAVIQAIDNDPLANHAYVRARTGAQFNTAIRKAQADFARITSPLYIIHGSGDRVVPIAGSRQLYERCGAQDKTMKIYEGGYHELWNDLDKQDAFAGIIAWITARL